MTFMSFFYFRKFPCKYVALIMSIKISKENHLLDTRPCITQVFAKELRLRL